MVWAEVPLRVERNCCQRHLVDSQDLSIILQNMQESGGQSLEMHIIKDPYLYLKVRPDVVLKDLLIQQVIPLG